MDMAPNIDYFDMPDSLKGQYQYYTAANMIKLKKAGYKHPFTSLEDALKDYVQHYLSRSLAYLD